MEEDQAPSQYGQQPPSPPTPPISYAGDTEREEKAADVPSRLTSQLPKTGLNTSSSCFYGKHRMAAAISNLENQIKIFEEELDQLETLGESSSVCEEFISSIESTSDPLLPETKGPVDVGWDRWFRGVQNSRRRWL